MKTCTLYVSGMHCASCEVLLEKKIKKLNGIQSVDASLPDHAVTVTYDNEHKPDIKQLNQDFSELGYTFSDQPLGEGKVTRQSIINIVATGIVFVIGYIILEDSNVLSRFSLDEGSTLPAFFALGVVASISSCAALTGGLLLSLSKQWNQLYGGKHESKRMYPVIMFSIGRLISYTLLGGVLGLIGSMFQISLQFTAVLVIVVSLLMLILGLQMLGVRWAKKIRIGFPRFVSRYVSDEQNFKGKYMPFAVGALTFFLPCGFTLMAQTVALATGNFLTSALMMLAFAIGTAPVLWFIGFSSVTFQKNTLFSNTFNVLAGVFIVLFGIFNINSQLNVLGLMSFNDVSRSSTTVETSEGLGVKMVSDGQNSYQSVTMEAREFGYYPEMMTLKAGVPVKLTVKNTNVLGCARAMYWPGIYDEVIILNGTESKAEFTPQNPGNYKVSCSMGMVKPVLVRVIN